MTLSNHLTFCASVSLSIKGSEAGRSLLVFGKLPSVKIFIPKESEYLKIVSLESVNISSKNQSVWKLYFPKFFPF